MVVPNWHGVSHKHRYLFDYAYDRLSFIRTQKYRQYMFRCEAPGNCTERYKVISREQFWKGVSVPPEPNFPRITLEDKIHAYLTSSPIDPISALKHVSKGMVGTDFGRKEHNDATDALAYSFVRDASDKDPEYTKRRASWFDEVIIQNELDPVAKHRNAYRRSNIDRDPYLCEEEPS